MVLALLRRRTLCFYSRFLLQVFKTLCFAVVLARSSFAVTQWITARNTDLLKTTKKTGFENVRNIMHDKNRVLHEVAAKHSFFTAHSCRQDECP